MNLTIQIDTPVLTPQELTRRSGIPTATISERMRNGEIPQIGFSLDPDKSTTRYVNMVLLSQICAAQEFDHPLLKVS